MSALKVTGKLTGKLTGLIAQDQLPTDRKNPPYRYYVPMGFSGRAVGDRKNHRSGR